MKIDIKILTDYKQTAIYTDIDKLDDKGIEKYLKYQGGYFKIIDDKNNVLFFQTHINDFLFSLLLRIPFVSTGQSIITLNIPNKEGYSIGIFVEGKNDLIIYEYKTVMHERIKSAEITQKIMILKVDFIIQVYSKIYEFNEIRKKMTTSKDFIFWDKNLIKAKEAIDNQVSM